MPSPRLRVLALALVLLAGLCAYGNAASGSFVFDDVYIVERNPAIRSLADIPALYRQHLWQPSGLGSRLYRPLTVTTLALDHAVWGQDVRGFRATNVLLHLAVCATLFWLLGRFGASPWLACAGAAVFAVHPLHTEVVDLAMNRSESLATLCYLLGLGALVTRGPPRWSRTALAALALAAGLLCRETPITLPFVAGLLFWLRPQGGPRVRLRHAAIVVAVLALVVLAYLALRAAVLSPQMPEGLGGHLEAGPVSADRLSRVATPLFDYVRMLLVPLPHRTDHASDYRVFSGAALWGAAALPVLLVTLALLRRKTSPRAAFAVGFFYVTLLPSTKLFADPAIFAERFAYLPSVALSLVVPGALGWLGGRLRPALVAATVVAVCAAGAMLSLGRNFAWRTEVALWTAELRAAPESASARMRLGTAYYNVGELVLAERLLVESIDGGWQHLTSYLMLALVRARLGHADAAAPVFEEVIRRWPENPDAYLSYAGLLLAEGKTERALDLTRRGLERKDTPYGRRLLADVLATLGRIGEAEDLMVGDAEIRECVP